MRRSRIFDEAAQSAFAALSGDFNPLHLDPIVARRTFFGRTIVHGVHLVLWALDQLSSMRTRPASLARLTVDFRKPVAVGVPVRIEADPDESGAACRLHCGEVLCATIDVEWAEPFAGRGVPVTQTASVASERPYPRHLAESEIAGLSGEIALALDAQLFAALFPSLADRLAPLTCATLLASTRLVGMECPGQNSIFRSLSLEFDAPGDEVPASLRWLVKRHDARFHLARIAIEAPGAHGTAEAFHRPEPAEQARAADLQRLITAGEFAGTSALVVGGSRGTGEVAAKLLALGGASVTFTYRSGKSDAERIVRELGEHGATARALELDATSIDENALARLDAAGRITHLLYFATPPIFVAERGIFDAGLFREFSRVYVEGFATLTSALLPRGLAGVLYPSSAALDELPLEMGEYAAAKSAGEACCAFLRKARPGLKVLAPRLPRLATDQTRSIVSARDASAESVMLPLLRELCRR